MRSRTCHSAFRGAPISLLHAEKPAEEEAKAAKKSPKDHETKPEDIIALALGESKKEKKKKEKKEKKPKDPEEKARRRAEREAKAAAALEAAQKSVSAKPADGAEPAAASAGALSPGRGPSPHEASSPSVSASPSASNSTPASPFIMRHEAGPDQAPDRPAGLASPKPGSDMPAAAAPAVVPAPAVAGAEVKDEKKEGGEGAMAPSGAEAGAAEGAAKAGAGGEGDSDEEFFGPFAAKKAQHGDLKAAPSALFAKPAAASSPRDEGKGAEGEEKVGVNFDEDLSLGGTAITRIAGLSVSAKRVASGKNLNLIGPRTPTLVKEAELTRVGQLEIEEGKVLRSWKKVKVVLKNNKLVVRIMC